MPLKSRFKQNCLLSHTPIEEPRDATGAEHLANALTINDTLIQLDLGDNPIGDVGLNMLAKAIRSISNRQVDRSLLTNQLLQEAFDFHANQINGIKPIKSKPLLLAYGKYILGTTAITAIGVGIYIAHHYTQHKW